MNVTRDPKKMIETNAPTEMGETKWTMNRISVKQAATIALPTRTMVNGFNFFTSQKMYNQHL